MREDLLTWVRDYCNNQDLEDEGAIGLFLDRIIAWLDVHVSGVRSEKLGDYMITFGAGARVENILPGDLLMFLRPYKRMKML